MLSISRTLRYPHKEREFWLWLNSWAIFLQRPSDLGYSNEGYDLPPFKVIYHEVQTDLADGGMDRDGQMNLIRDMAIGLVGASKEKRDTLGNDSSNRAWRVKDGTV